LYDIFSSSPQLTMRLGGDPEHLWVKARPQLSAAGVQDLGLASDLDPPDTPGVHRREVVNHEGDLGVSDDVAVLLSFGEMVAPDVDGVVVGVVAETSRDHMRGSI
jgi:hypothetical protein